MAKICILLLLFASIVRADSKTNILFILADDLGINDLSVEGSNYYETPHIDRIAKEGMRFTNGYSTCQVCSPSRASIMSGQYPARVGITDWIGAKTGTNWKRNDRVLPAEYSHTMSTDNITIAEALKEGGYKTFFAGKWHIGGKGSMPEDHGFEINKGGHGRGSPPGGFFAPYTNPKLSSGPDGESLPVRLANETAAFIKDANRAGAPFFAFLSFYSVHSPLQTTPELWRKYREKAAKNPHQGDRFKVDRTLPVRQVQDCPVYAGMMESMDDAVGIVLKTLDDLGLEEDTVVIFTSDNGGVSSGDAFATSCLPLRGGKGRQWEGGIRQPYYIKAPGITTPGSTNESFATGTDFFPTALELAGLPLLPDQHRDGRSLLPQLTGAPSPDRALFWHYPHYGNQGGEPSSIVRKGDLKLIRYYEDGRHELYNVVEDISEANDISSSMPREVADLSSLLDAHLKEVDAKIPQADSRFDAEKKKQQLHTLHTRRKEALERQHAKYLDPDYTPNDDWWGSKLTVD